jgi:predicted ribosome quality control (RQC) complex YloA/Tae2 family protein
LVLVTEIFEAKILELSGLELHYLIGDINERLNAGYYVGSISSISEDSFSLRMHHSSLPDIALVITTKGIWITKMKFRSFQDSPIINNMKTQIERAKFESIEQIGDERIAYVNFRHLDGRVRILVAEFFRKGNIIICDENKIIVAILNPVEVRHRTLKTGLIYHPPPPRGINVFELSTTDLLELHKKEVDRDIEVEKWFGRNVSLSKKFIDEIVSRASMKHRKLKDTNSADMEMLFELTKGVVLDLSNPVKHTPLVVLDNERRPIDVMPLRLGSIPPSVEVVSSGSLMEAVDTVMSHMLIQEATDARTVDLESKITVLKHDYDQQIKAEAEVLSKSNAIRKLAHDFMASSITNVNDTEDQSFIRTLEEHSSRIVTMGGRKFLEIENESIPFDPRLPKMSSLLFDRAKELERGCQSIRNAKSKLLGQMQELRDKAVSVQKKVVVKPQIEKEWFERYRWFISSDGFLCIGGRDSSSNSAIIRKHLTEHDLVFHAEVHGSPFFIIKSALHNGLQTNEESIMEAAQATVSFSRAWKDGLSVADAYWVASGQVKKGAPTGQFLPRGSFVVQGKRNYIKGVTISLALGITSLDKRYTLMCGPQEAVKRRSLAYCVLLPGGIDPMHMAKRFKAEMINLFSAPPENRDLFEYLKELSTDDVVKTLPHGQSKILLTRKGDFEANQNKSSQ